MFAPHESRRVPERQPMTLRAKIDLASGNFNMRDPVIYRIRHMHHHRQGDKWCIYPMYDFAHPIQDALEGITHSLCSLEFEAHRPLYDWVVNNVSVPAIEPRQIEFARLGIDHTGHVQAQSCASWSSTSHVSGWDDPAYADALRSAPPGATRRHSIRNFCERIGVAKAASTVEYAFLEHCLREDLNDSATRTMAVLHPLRLTVTNYPEGQTEIFEVENHPNHPEDGHSARSRSPAIFGSRQDDFLDEPIPKYKRLCTPTAMRCRLKGAYVINLHRLRQGRRTATSWRFFATYDPASAAATPPTAARSRARPSTGSRPTRP
ncbi:MAG: glutamate--tRNA ligase family protein [Oscillospiraceae bacterium]